jgi:hypothetical protein
MFLSRIILGYRVLLSQYKCSEFVDQSSLLSTIANKLTEEQADLQTQRHGSNRLKGEQVDFQRQHHGLKEPGEQQTDLQRQYHRSNKPGDWRHSPQKKYSPYLRMHVHCGLYNTHRACRPRLDREYFEVRCRYFEREWGKTGGSLHGDCLIP